MYQVLHENYYNLRDARKYLVQTTSQQTLEFHGMRKNLHPNILPEKQHANPIKGSTEKPHIGQGSVGLRRKGSAPINQTSIPPPELSQKIPGETKIETRKTNHVNSMDPMYFISNADEGMTHIWPLIPDVPFYPGPTYRPLPKQLDPTCLEARKVHKVQIV